MKGPLVHFLYPAKLQHCTVIFISNIIDFLIDKFFKMCYNVFATQFNIALEVYVW